MATTNLLTLPRELRDLIYTHLYPPHSNTINLFIIGHATRYHLSTFTINNKPGNDRNTWSKALQDSTALLRTCKQIRHEALPFFEESIIHQVVVEGQAPGFIGFRLSERQFEALVGRMRIITLTLKMRYVPYGPVSSSPSLSDVEQALSPLKRNTATLLRMLKGNEKFKVESIRLEFEARMLEGLGNADSAVQVLEGLGDQSGVKVYNVSEPRGAITEGCMRRLIEKLGGVECTEPQVDGCAPVVDK